MYATHVSGIPYIMYPQSLKIGKPNNLSVFVSLKNKGNKQDSQNRLSQISEVHSNTKD